MLFGWIPVKANSLITYSEDMAFLCNPGRISMFREVVWNIYGGCYLGSVAELNMEHQVVFGSCGLKINTKPIKLIVQI